MNIDAKEFFVPIDNEIHRIGRLTILRQGAVFNVEIDIIFKESHKIWHHVKTHYGCDDMQDAVSQGRQTLYDFLKSPKV